MRITEISIVESLRNENPCWKGYHPVGTKDKGGRTVPNCVPVEEANEQVDPIILKALERIRPGIQGNAGPGTELYTAAKEALALEYGLITARNNAPFINNLNQLQDLYRKRQGVKEEFDSGEYNDEAGMARTNLETIARAAHSLLNTIDDHENLPEWVQEKIAKVEGMLTTANNYLQSQAEQGIDPVIAEEFSLIESAINMLAERNQVDAEVIWEDLESLTDDELYVFAATQPVMENWQKANKKDKTDGMSKKAVKAYRREHPGSKLQTAVTTKPSKLKKGSKASKRRSSYCSRSKGQMKMHSISCQKTPDKPICKARRRWNCE